MLKRLSKYLWICSFLMILSCNDNVSTSAEYSHFPDRLKDLMQEAIDNSYNQIPGIILSIKSPKLEKAWDGKLGFDSVKKTDSLATDQPFRIASITKTFVATSILRLHEMDSLSIYDPLAKYISDDHIKILQTDGYDASKILIYHCLNHTSGLFDYAMNGSDYVSIAKQTPQRRWTRTEQLKLAMEYGDPVGQPGDKYLYSDTGYILLGEILESFYNADLAAAIRDLVGFEKLGMNHTYLESLETTPKNLLPQVKRYLGNDEYSTFDPSVDLYGGGGLVSTCSDLTVFLQALFNDKIYQKKSTLDLMLTKHDFISSYDSEEDARFKDYRMGLWKVTIYGEDAYMHSGLWGTTFIHIPEQNSSYAVNFTKGWNNRLLKKSILLINNLEDK